MPIRSNQPWNPEPFRVEMLNMPSSDLVELQFTGPYERVPERVTWRTYLTDKEEGHGKLPKAVIELADRCVRSNVSPYDIAQMARHELMMRAKAAEDEMESAADHVKWSRTPIEGFDYTYDFPMMRVRSLPGFERVRANNWDVVWAYIFGEPLYVIARVGNLDHAVTAWEPKPNRVPRSAVADVLFAMMIPTDEPDENDFWALMRLVNGRSLLLHYQDAIGLTHFHQFRTIQGALDRLPPQVRRMLGDLRYIALTLA